MRRWRWWAALSEDIFRSWLMLTFSTVVVVVLDSSSSCFELRNRNFSFRQTHGDHGRPTDDSNKRKLKKCISFLSLNIEKVSDNWNLWISIILTSDNWTKVHFAVRSELKKEGTWWTVWPEKNRQMSIKVAKNDFTRKMIDFDIFTKIA